MTWEEFVELVLEQLHVLHQDGRRIDLTILLNRKDKLTGTSLPLSREDVRIAIKGM